MGKRKGEGNKGGNFKKHKQDGFIDPNTSGVYATCNRGKELQCRKELMNLFTEKAEAFYNLNDQEVNNHENFNKELSVEEKIELELSNLQRYQCGKEEILNPINLGCECLVFIKTRKPIEPESFVEKICKELVGQSAKNTRYTQKLTPITSSVSPKVEEIKKMAKRVLGPHFHAEQDQSPLKFAISVSKRNFNAMSSQEIIRTIAECIGKEHGHSVDLKNYDKLILVECYKSNIGMSVVNDYDKLMKFNLQKIFDKAIEAKS